MLLPKQIWKDVKGYEGLYQVSNTGRVRSLNYRNTGKVQVLKSQGQTQAYLLVRLCKEGASKLYLIHRLVAEAFIPNPNNYKEINHVDENKQNNIVSNLEWCTREYNQNYGTINKRRSEKHKGKILSEEHKAKISKAKKGNHNSAKKVICIELKRIFDSVSEAAEYLDYNVNTFYHAINNSGRVKGYTFKYIESEVISNMAKGMRPGKPMNPRKGVKGPKGINWKVNDALDAKKEQEQNEKAEAVPEEEKDEK